MKQVKNVFGPQLGGVVPAVILGFTWSVFPNLDVWVVPYCEPSGCFTSANCGLLTTAKIQSFENVNNNLCLTKYRTDMWYSFKYSLFCAVVLPQSFYYSTYNHFKQIGECDQSRGFRRHLRAFSSAVGWNGFPALTVWTRLQCWNNIVLMESMCCGVLFEERNIIGY